MSGDEDIARIEGTHAIGLAFVRSCILLNGGAFAILLAYMASSTKQSLIKPSFTGLRLALSCFLGSIILVMSALLYSYVYKALNFESLARTWFDGKIIPLNANVCFLSLIAFSADVVTLINSSGFS
ncbi:MAG: hypothetical protein ACJAZ1_001851 [Yoonia sp.]|jgi:hypothetical protein